MSKIHVGVARVCITPPIGTAMSGYFYPRYSTGVLDDLYATAVAFDDGEKRAIVISLDLCGLKNQWWLDNCKRNISEFCSVSLDAVIISCTHTHTGPVVGPDATSGADSNKLYDEYLMVKVRDAAYLALQNMAPAKFYTASGECKDIAFVRLFRMKDGSVRTNPGRGNPDVVAPISKPYEELTLLKMERENEKDIFIVNYGVHACVVGGTQISADFPGVLRNAIEEAVPNSICVFLQGAEGDLNHVDVKVTEAQKGPSHAQFMGKRLAETVLSICNDAEEVKADEIHVASRRIEIPANKENDKLEEAKRILSFYRSGKEDEEAMQCAGAKQITSIPEAHRIAELSDGPDTLSFRISAVSVGHVAFAALPGEPFCKIGENIIKSSPFLKTMICVLCDGGEVYFPTSNLYDENAYEVTSSFVKKGADEILTTEMLRLLEDIKK